MATLEKDIIDILQKTMKTRLYPEATLKEILSTLDPLSEQIFEKRKFRIEAAGRRDPLYIEKLGDIVSLFGLAPGWKFICVTPPPAPAPAPRRSPAPSAPTLESTLNEFINQEFEEEYRAYNHRHHTPFAIPTSDIASGMFVMNKSTGEDYIMVGSSDHYIYLRDFRLNRVIKISRRRVTEEFLQFTLTAE